jgi:uncharacterized protein (TIGR03437 family)
LGRGVGDDCAVKRWFRWSAVFFLALIFLWIAAIGQGPSIAVPFAVAPILTSVSGPGAPIAVFARTLTGSYVSAAYTYSSGFPLVSGMSAISQLLSEGVANLLAQPAGPANVGLAVQLGTFGKFTSGGALGAAWVTFSGSAVYVAVGTAALLYNGSSSYNIGPNPDGVLAGDFNGDGVMDLAVPFLGLGPSSPGGLAVLINNGDGTFKSPVMYTPGTEPISAATLDVNGDGILDIVVVDDLSSSVYVLLGNGDGTFKPAAAYAAGNDGLCITLADVNGDGSPDIAETAADGNIWILLNNGSGTFRAPIAVKTPSTSQFYIAAGDFNGDGRLDLVTADGLASTITIFLNSGGGDFAQGSTYATSYSPNSLVLTDYNGDGKLDILNATGDARGFGASADSGNLDLFLGNGDGTFQGVAVTPGGATTQNPFLAVADFTGNGVPDAVVAGSGQNVALFPGTKTGAFQPPTVVSTGALTPNGGTSGDFNGDGMPDLAVTDASGAVGILLNSSSGLETPSTFSSGGEGSAGIVTADFNGDGKLDLAVANSGSGTTAVFFGGGHGTFQLSNTYPTGITPAQVISTDVNGDGKPDLIVLDPGNMGVSNGALYVLLNNGSGGFSAPVAYTPSAYPISVGAGDLNGDGKPDLVVAVSDTQYNYYLAVLLNNGSGGFGTATLMNTEFGPSSIAIADFNADGKADLVTAHCCGATNLTYQQGNGDGTFSAEVDFNGGQSPELVQVTDFRGTGAADLAVFLGGAGMESGMAGVLNSPQAAAVGSLSNGEAAGGSANIAQQAIVSAYAGQGTHLATTTTTAPSPAWPTNLGGTTVSVRDSAGMTWSAPIYFVSPAQVNYALPAGVAQGQATVTITASDGTTSSGPANIVAVSPGLFAVGPNLAAANVIRISGGVQTVENDYQVNSSGAIVALPIPLNPSTDQVYLVLYGTGIRNAPLSAVTVTVGGASVGVQFAGAQQTYMGLDQVNIGPLPATLAGAGSVAIQLTASGTAANVVNISVQ